MFKLVLLSTLLAIAAARPSIWGHGPLLHSISAPATIVHEPALASVGHIVKSIPTAVSHQSISQVHSSAHIVQPIVAPILKTTVHAAPVLHAPALLAGPAHGWAPSSHGGWW